MKKLLFTLALLVGFLSSCGDEEVVLDPDSIGTAYYPLEVGAFTIFNVKETVYSENEGVTSLFQVRETFNEFYKDQAGKEWFRVEISRRDSEGDSWRVIGVKTISKTLLGNSSGNLLIQENNRAVVNMVYPVAEGKTWNPNAFNTAYFPNQEDANLREEYLYQNVEKPFEKDGQTFSNTVTILKSEVNTSLDVLEQSEVFSFNQGPVYRYYKKLEYCSDSSGDTCPYLEDYIVTGTERIETFASAGKID
jgi:hypothetical protein